MQRSPRTITVLAAALAVSTVALAEQSKQGGQKTAAAAAGAQPTLLGQYGDWGAYTATPEGKKVCFTLAKPKSSTTNPAGRKRDPAYVFISTRPAENVRNEISVIIGYPFKGRMPPPRSAPPNSRCTPRTTAPGSRTSPRRRA